MRWWPRPGFHPAFVQWWPVRLELFWCHATIVLMLTEAEAIVRAVRAATQIASNAKIADSLRIYGATARLRAVEGLLTGKMTATFTPDA